MTKIDNGTQYGARILVEVDVANHQVGIRETDGPCMKIRETVKPRWRFRVTVAPILMTSEAVTTCVRIRYMSMTDYEREWQSHAGS